MEQLYSVEESPQQERWDSILEDRVFWGSDEYIDAITVGRQYTGKRTFQEFRKPRRRVRFGPLTRACLICGASYCPRRYGPDEAYSGMVAAGLTAERIAEIPRGRRGGPRPASEKKINAFAASVVCSLVLDGFRQRTVAGVASLSDSWVTREMHGLGWKRLPRAAHNFLDAQRDEHWFELHLRQVHPEAVPVYEGRQRNGFTWNSDDVLRLHPTRIVELPGALFLEDETVAAEDLRRFRERHADLPTRVLQDYDPVPTYEFSLRLGDSSPKAGAARPAEVQAEGRFPPPALGPPFVTEEEEMSTATAEAIISRLDRIELLESMRAETMDHVRATVDRMAAEREDDKRVQEAARRFRET